MAIDIDINHLTIFADTIWPIIYHVVLIINKKCNEHEFEMKMKKNNM